MRGMLKAMIFGSLLVATAAPARAQDEGGQEIVVTGFRKLAGNDADDVREIRPVLPASALTMRRTADFAVQQVTIGGDTREELKAKSELTLSVVNPEQYRRPIIAQIAKEAAATSAPFGTGYGVEVTGLERPVQWTQASLTEVLLYLPATYTVRPHD
jgi:hypothetical protein